MCGLYQERSPCARACSDSSGFVPTGTAAVSTLSLCGVLSLPSSLPILFHLLIWSVRRDKSIPRYADHEEIPASNTRKNGQRRSAKACRRLSKDTDIGEEGSFHMPYVRATGCASRQEFTSLEPRMPITQPRAHQGRDSTSHDSGRGSEPERDCCGGRRPG